ncbi:MAG: HDOD domain-containing protein [Myxococcaceae bacterium]|jgi:HD-like signal output (HDOD) protein|nr:HDOD domain-containing protein [Myxococcaceae bacterium]
MASDGNGGSEGLTLEAALEGKRGAGSAPPADPAELAKLAEWTALMQARGSTVSDELPAFPGTATKLLSMLEAGDPEPRALVEVIQTDAPVAAQVLKLANSAAFTRGVEITTVQLAATRLGVRTVTAVALAASTKALLDQQERQILQAFRERWRALSDTSLRVATAARALSKKVNRGNADEAFLAGLMVDLGKAVGLRLVGTLVQEGELPATISTAAVEQLLERTHVEFGVDLTAVWDLPGFINHVCAHHHDPTAAAVPVNDVLHVVRVAAMLDALQTNPYTGVEVVSQLRCSAEALGLVEPRLRMAG